MYPVSCYGNNSNACRLKRWINGDGKHHCPCAQSYIVLAWFLCLEDYLEGRGEAYDCHFEQDTEICRGYTCSEIYAQLQKVYDQYTCVREILT